MNRNPPKHPSKKQEAAPLPPSDSLPSVPPPDERLQHVMGWIIAGGTEFQVEESIRRHWPDAEARPLILRAIDELRNAGRLETSVVRGWCFEAYRDLYRKLLKDGDYAGALKAVRHIYDLTRPEG